METFCCVKCHHWTANSGPITRPIKSKDGCSDWSREQSENNSFSFSIWIQKVVDYRNRLTVSILLDTLKIISSSNQKYGYFDTFQISHVKTIQYPHSVALKVQKSYKKQILIRFSTQGSTDININCFNKSKTTNLINIYNLVSEIDSISDTKIPKYFCEDSESSWPLKALPLDHALPHTRSFFPQH